MTTFIYGLTDPRDGSVRYVGKADDPAGRLREHVYEALHMNGTHKRNWLRKLADLDLIDQVTVTVLEECETEIWQERERWWIAHYGRENLVNATAGGDGISGYAHTPETKQMLSAILKGRGVGVPKSAETRAKMSAGKRGKPSALKGRKLGPRSEETKAKMSASTKGRTAWNKGRRQGA